MFICEEDLISKLSGNLRETKVPINVPIKVPIKVPINIGPRW